MGELNWLVLGGFVVFALIAGIFVRRSKHPEVRPLAAYLIFMTVFSAVAMGLYAAGNSVFLSLGQSQLLERPSVAATFLIVICLLALLAGRWQIRRPPLRSPRL